MPEQELQYQSEWENSQVNRFDSILKRSVAALLRESSTEYNFLEIKDKLTSVRENVQILAQTYEFWAELSDNKRSNINGGLDDMIAQFDSMEQFDPKQNNAWEFRNNIIQNFNTRYNGFYDNVVAPLNGYLGRKAYSQELTSEFGQQAKAELAEVRRVRKQIENVQKAVSSAASVAGDVANTAYAVSFKNQAQEHTRDAGNWLKITFGAMLFALIVSIVAVIDIARELNDDKFTMQTEATFIKLAILTFSYVLIRFCAKNYSAHKHLYVINKQRSNVLQSMEAYRESASDPDVKDAILLASVGAAYSQQETGFITTKEGAGSEDISVTKAVDTALRKRI